MTKNELDSIWEYFLCLESDLSNTSRYIEPQGQENVHSFEFAKIIILACTEIENVFKLLCQEIDGNAHGNISEYKEIILQEYPRIVEAPVSVSRLGRVIIPFENWDKEKLFWWDAYSSIKHNRGKYFDEATYNNAVYSMSGLYILVFYLAKRTEISFRNYASTYIQSEFSEQNIFCSIDKELPDFEEDDPKQDK